MKNSKHFRPHLFKSSYDGGINSGVNGFWLIEWKPCFSLVFLKFNKGTRENYHNHAFNAYTWFLWGNVTEHHKDGRKLKWYPSLWPKYTPKECFHKVEAHEDTYAFSIRGPCDIMWKEYNEEKDEEINLTHGREIVNTEENKDKLD